MSIDSDERRRKLDDAKLLVWDLAQLSGLAREVGRIADKAAGEAQDAGKKEFLCAFAQRASTMHADAHQLWLDFQAEFNIPKSHKVS